MRVIWRGCLALGTGLGVLLIAFYLHCDGVPLCGTCTVSGKTTYACLWQD